MTFFQLCQHPQTRNKAPRLVPLRPHNNPHWFGHGYQLFRCLAMNQLFYEEKSWMLNCCDEMRCYSFLQLNFEVTVGSVRSLSSLLCGFDTVSFLVPAGDDVRSARTDFLVQCDSTYAQYAGSSQMWNCELTPTTGNIICSRFSVTNLPLSTEFLVARFFPVTRFFCWSTGGISTTNSTAFFPLPKRIMSFERSSSIASKQKRQHPLPKL